MHNLLRLGQGKGAMKQMCSPGNSSVYCPREMYRPAATIQIGCAACQPMEPHTSPAQAAGCTPDR
jgi:hypothetical protein